MSKSSRARSTARIGRRLRSSTAAVERLESRLALAVATPFDVRFTTTTTGDITFAANTLMTAPATPEGDAARAGVGTKLNNNDFTMVYVDIDADPTTFNSSSADLVVPDGAQVLFAGLYWGGRTSTSAAPGGETQLRNTVKFQAPGASGYTTLGGTIIGTTASSYQGFADVTSLVQAGGAGSYTVANVRAISDKSDYYAGWSLVVAYQAPDEPARNLTVFDGYASVTSGDPNVTIGIAGFQAPTSGPVNATLGFITYEGDLGSSGDRVFFDGGTGPVQLGDAANPRNNFFNSTISNRGSLVATKDPNYVNQMGFDADLIEANGIIANGATSATIALSTGGETYYPGVVTSAIEVFAPELTVAKQVEDLDGGVVEAGDVLRYTITVSNAADALDAAAKVILADAIPAFTSYKAGSLVITSGANAGPKTDAVDGDQGEFLAGSNTVQFQLGTGAGGGTGTPVGGLLLPGETTTITFEVVVAAGVPASTLIPNTAVVTYEGRDTGLALSAIDTASVATPLAADLAVTKTDGRTQYVPGMTLTYTIVVTNDGPSDLSGISVVDVMPAAFATATWTAAYSGGSTGPAGGSGDIDVLVDLLDGGTATFTVTAVVRPEAFGDITNTATVAPPAGIPDPDPSNNTATDTNTLVLPAKLGVEKSVLDVDGGFVVGGDTLRYTIVVSNTGTGPTDTAVGVNLADLIPALTAYVPGSATTSQGTVNFAGGSVTASLGALAVGESATIEFEVTVDAGILPSTVITNAAVATGTGQLSGLPLGAEDSVGVATPPAADLALVKTGPATFVPGEALTYVIVVSNGGPTAVTGATVSDTFAPELSGITWTVAYTGAGSDGPETGSGDIAAAIDLAVGGTATFTITATPAADLPSNAVLTNTARADTPAGMPDPNPGNNESTTSSTPTFVTDLAITKASDSATYVRGQPLVYTITVTNTGPSFAWQAAVLDPLDPAIIDVAAATWTAVFSGTGSGGVTAGSGSLDEIVDLAAGGTAVYTVTAPIRPAASGTLVNTARVETSNLSNDPDPADNTATTTTTPDLTPGVIVTPDLGCDSGPLVSVLDPVTGAVRTQFNAYEPGFRGGVRVYGADVTGDGVPEIVTAPGPGRPGEIRVFTPEGVELVQYRSLPFGAGYDGGVEVAVGSLTGPGTIELVAGQSRGGLVNVFTVTPGGPQPVASTPARQVQPFGAGFRGGVTVAAADMGTFTGGSLTSNDPDGIDELAIGSGPGRLATVNVYNGVPSSPQLVNTLRPFAGVAGMASYARGVGVAALPSSAGAADRLLVSAGTSGGSLVETYAGTGRVPTGSFAAFSGSRAATWVAALDETQIFAVEGIGGHVPGVRQASSVSGPTTTLTANPQLPAPQRVGVLPARQASTSAPAPAVAAAPLTVSTPAAGPAPVAIEESGRVTLAVDAAGNLLADGQSITFNGLPVPHTTDPSAVWRALAAEVVDGVNQVVLRHSSGHLHIWRLDAAWRQVSGAGWIAPGSAAFHAAELAFDTDLDGDGLVTIESAGGVSLAYVASNAVSIYGSGNVLLANGTPITFAGSPVGYHGLVAGGWTPMAADVDQGVNTVVLEHAGGNLHFLRLDAGWGNVSGDGWVAPGSGEFFTAEVTFGVDLDGDGVQTIEAAGSVVFTFDGDGNLRANDTLVMFNGGPVDYHGLIMAGWQAMAADVDGGVNTVVLKHASGHVHFWRMDAGWHQVGGDGWVAFGSLPFHAAEAAFGADLDGDGVRTIEAAGSVVLTQDRVGQLRVQLVSGGLVNPTATPIGFNGRPVNSHGAAAAGWLVAAAEVDDDQNTILLKHASGFLHFWRMDAGWNQVAGDGWLAPGTPEYLATEIAFGVDLDASLRIGA